MRAVLYRRYGPADYFFVNDFGPIEASQAAGNSLGRPPNRLGYDPAQGTPCVDIEGHHSAHVFDVGKSGFFPFPEGADIDFNLSLRAFNRSGWTLKPRDWAFWAWSQDDR